MTFTTCLMAHPIETKGNSKERSSVFVRKAFKYTCRVPNSSKLQAFTNSKSAKWDESATAYTDQAFRFLTSKKIEDNVKNLRRRQQQGVMVSLKYKHFEGALGTKSCQLILITSDPTQQKAMNKRLPQYNLKSQLLESFTSLWLVLPDKNELQQCSKEVSDSW